MSCTGRAMRVRPRPQVLIVCFLNCNWPCQINKACQAPRSTIGGEALAFYGRLEGLGKGITRLAYGILDILSASCIFMFRSLSLSFLFPLAFLP